RLSPLIHTAPHSRRYQRDEFLCGGGACCLWRVLAQAFLHICGIFFCCLSEPVLHPGTVLGGLAGRGHGFVGGGADRFPQRAEEVAFAHLARRDLLGVVIDEKGGAAFGFGGGLGWSLFGRRGSLLGGGSLGCSLG